MKMKKTKFCIHTYPMIAGNKKFYYDDGTKNGILFKKEKNQLTFYVHKTEIKGTQN